MTVTSLPSAITRPRRALGVTPWVVQLALAAMFGFAGVLKLSTPVPDLARMLPWAADVPEPLVRLIGGSELAGALGLLLPSLTRIAPWLTPLAAAGLTTVMVLAAAFHVMRGEPVVVPLTLGALAAFVAWGRFRAAPIRTRDGSHSDR